MASKWRDDPEIVEMVEEIQRFGDAAGDLSVRSERATAAFDWEARVGASLRRARERLGASQSDVAAELAGWGLEMHQTTLAKLEAGKRPIRLAEMFALASLYGLTPGTVLLDAGSTIDGGDDVDRRLAEVETTRRETEEEFERYSHAVFAILAHAADERAALLQVLREMAKTGSERWPRRDGEHPTAP